MSTRANIIMTDENTKLYFYRHSDGYPETTMESLKKFCRRYEVNMRPNVEQSAGWLILHGADEYGFNGDLTGSDQFEWNQWKCGAYEPSSGIHDDVEYIYTIDLVHGILKCFEARCGYDGKISEAFLQTPIHEFGFSKRLSKINY